MATNLVLGESKSLVHNGPGVMFTSNGERGYESAERKTANRVRVLEAMLRQMWRGYRRQVSLAYPELNPRYMFIYEGRVFRIHPKALYILTPVHYQTFLEIRNTAWCVTVLLPEYTLAMSKWIKEGIVTELIPNDRDFKKLTWIPASLMETYQYHRLKLADMQTSPSVTLDMSCGGPIMACKYMIVTGISTWLTSATNWMNQYRLSHLRHL